MSDPVTNIQIEDVLSSIRRLVAEGEKSKQPETEAVKDKAPERLVLTPALRVTDQPTDEETPEDISAMAAPDAPVSDENELGALLLVQSDDDTAADDIIATLQDDQIGPTSETAVYVDADDVPFDRTRLEESHIPFDRASLEATIAELEAAVTEQPDEWEPDGTETDIDPTWARAGFPSDQPVEDAEFIDADRDGVKDGWADEQDELDPFDAADAVAKDASESDELSEPKELWDDVITEQTVAAVAASLGDVKAGATASNETEETSEFDAEVAHVPDDGRATDADATMATFRHTNAAQDDADHDADYADDLREDHAAVNEADLAEYLTDDSVIDEAMLRQMVLEIVREELQGKLGERITRNVRKLVRREIHRVLTSPDLD